MILRSVRVENFLSHECSEVHFRDALLWLVAGDNGSGKSALFDAVEFALFGQHRGGQQQAGLLVKHGAQRAKIQVVLSNGGHEYRITREIDSDNTNRAGLLDVWDEATNSWKPQNVGAGVRAVWDWVERNIVSHEHFCSAIYLRQNQTAHFLRGSAGDRSKRFAALVDLSHYTELAQKADTKAREAQSLHDEFAARRKELGDLSDEQLSRLQKQEELAQQALDERTAKHQGTQAILADARKWAELQQERQKWERRLQEILPLLDNEAQIRAAAERVSEWERVGRDLSAYWSQRDTAHKRRDEAAKENGAAHGKAQEAEKVTDELESLRARLKAITDDDLPEYTEQRDAAKQQQERMGLEKRIAQQIALAKKARAKVKTYEGADTGLQAMQNREHLLPRWMALVQAHSKLHSTKSGLDRAQTAAAKAIEASTRAAKDLDRALETEQLAQQQYEGWRERVVQLEKQIAGLQGQVEARSRIEGAEEECPVCAQPLDALTHEHVREVLQGEIAQVEALRRELAEVVTPARDQAKKALEEAKRSVSRLQEEKERLEKSREELAADATKAQGNYNTAEQLFQHAQTALMVETPISQSTVDLADEAWLERERAEITKELPVLMGAATELDAARQSLTETTIALKTLCGQRAVDIEPLGDSLSVAQIDELASKAESDLKLAQTRIAELERELKEKQKQEVALTAKITKLKAEAEAARQTARRASEQAEQADDQAEKFATKVTYQWKLLLADRDRYLAEEEEIARLRTLAAKLDEIEPAQSERQTLSLKLQDIEVREETIPVAHRIDLEVAQAQAQAAETARDKAIGNYKSSCDDIQRLKEARRQDEEYRLVVEEADVRYSDLRSLAELLKPDGPIQTTVAEQEQRRISSEANEILSLLNDPLRIRIDRARRAADGQDVTIIDTSDVSAGGAEGKRYFEFLSGGEQFRVALALALALHRRIGRSAGTIIVDEGFGALDKDRRDALAVQITNTSEGILKLGLAHSLVISSHSAEVQRHFPDRWLVEKQGGTARVRRAEDSATMA